MIDKKREKEFEWLPCIQYLVIIKNQTEALLDSGSEVNAMNPTFAFQLGFRIQKTNIGAQKIDGTILETYGMVVSIFSLLDKDGWKTFLEEGFLLADVKPNVVFGMLFLTMSNANVDFQAQNL